MERQPRILVVDDTTRNIRLMEASLGPRGYTVIGATSGADALLSIAAQPPDLVLLDVVMPGMDGYAVCRRLRADPATRFLPVVMVTASGDQEKLSALEAGADDFVQKPFNQAELLARVASLVRIKTYQDTIQRQTAELAEWNRTLESRVQEQVTELERLGRLKRFLAPQVAELLVSADGEALLESHRRQIAVIACHLPGFSAIAETSAPEEALDVLRAYHAAIGSVIFNFEATVGPLVEDRVMVLFNDPLPVDDPAGQAVRAAMAMRDRVHELLVAWRRAGYDLDFGIGIDMGYATLGTIGFAGRTEYGAIGHWPLIETLIRAVGDQTVLLVVDNCEHLIEAAAQLASDLAFDTHLAGLSLLATGHEGAGPHNENRPRFASEANVSGPTMAQPA